MNTALVRQELAPPLELVIPSRWAVTNPNATQKDVVDGLDQMAGTLKRGAEALCGLYMRICHTIREHNVPDEIARGVLSKHLAPPRVSEILRVANAPNEVYRRYTAGFFGFKAALRECRGYHCTPEQRLSKRRIERAAHRLVKLCGQSKQEVRILGFRITIEPD